MRIDEIQKLADNLQAVCQEARMSARRKLYGDCVKNYKEVDTGLFPLSNYIVDCDGDLYFLKEWAGTKTRYWGNGVVASAQLYGEKDYAYTTARRIKLDGTLAAKETELVMVVDGWEDEEAGYLDYHFELNEDDDELVVQE